MGLLSYGGMARLGNEPGRMIGARISLSLPDSNMHHLLTKVETPELICGFLVL